MSERRHLLRWWALVVALVITLYLCWLMLKPFVGVISWAAVLVIIFYPVHKRILRATKSPALSALISCALVILVILVPVTLITIAVIGELSGAMQNLQAALNYVLDPNSRLLAWIGRYVDLSKLQSDQYLLDQLSGMSGSIAGRTLGFLGGLISVIVQMFFVIFTMYYFFKDGERIQHAIRDLLPLENNQAEAIMARTREVIDASVYGVIAVSIIQGTLGGLAFWILGLPSAIIWGVAMTFLSMIPMLGAFVVWVPAAIYLALTGHWTKAIILVLWGTLVIGMIDNFLRPKLVGGRTRLHELLIFFSVLGGLAVFGVLGVVLGPVVLAIAVALRDVFQAAQTKSAD